MHLATHVYRAVENRRSVVTATHGGFSAWIDPAGRIRAKGTRGAAEVVGADVVSLKAKRQGLYGTVDLGETWSLCSACLAYAVWLAALSRNAISRCKRRKASASDKQCV